MFYLHKYEVIFRAQKLKKLNLTKNAYIIKCDKLMLILLVIVIKKM